MIKIRETMVLLFGLLMACAIVSCQQAKEKPALTDEDHAMVVATRFLTIMSKLLRKTLTAMSG